MIYSVEVDGVGAIRELELEGLPSGTILFSGGNGAGKTTVAEALFACLYGYFPQAGTSKQDAGHRIPHDAEMSVEFSTYDGQRYNVTRGFRRGSAGGIAHKVMLTRRNDSTWELIAGPRVRECEAEIERRFGPASVALATWMSTQARRGDLVLTPPVGGKSPASVRREVFAEMLNLGALTAAADRASESARELEREHRVLEARAATVTEHEIRLADMNERIAEREKLAVECREKVSAALSRVEALRPKVDVMEALRRELGKGEELLEHLRGEQEKWQTRAAENRQNEKSALENHDAARDSMERVRTLLDACSQRLSALAEMDALWRDAQGWRARKEKARNEVSSRQHRFDVLMAEAKIAQDTEGLAALCEEREERLREVTKRDKGLAIHEQRVQGNRKRRDAIHVEIVDAEARVQEETSVPGPVEICRTCPLFQRSETERQERIGKLKKELQVIDECIERDNAAIEEIAAFLESVGDIQRAREEASESRQAVTALKRAESAKAQIREAQDRLEVANKKLICVLNEKKPEWESAVDVSAELTKTRVEHESLNGQARAFETERDNALSAAVGYRQQGEDYAAEAAKLQPRINAGAAFVDEKREELAIAVDNAGEASQELEKANRDLFFAERELREVEHEIAGIAGESREVEARIAELRDVSEQAKIIATKRDAYRLCSRAWGPRGAQSVWLEQEAAAINDICNDVLAETVGSKSSMGITVARPRADGTLTEDCALWYVDENGARTAEACSGGEKALMSLTMRIAMARWNFARTGTRMPFLILDEPVDGVEEGRVDGVMRFIDRLVAQNIVRQVIMISHNAGLKAALQHGATTMEFQDGRVSR